MKEGKKEKGMIPACIETGCLKNCQFLLLAPRETDTVILKHEFCFFFSKVLLAQAAPGDLIRDSLITLSTLPVWLAVHVGCLNLGIASLPPFVSCSISVPRCLENAFSFSSLLPVDSAPPSLHFFSFSFVLLLL